MEAARSLSAPLDASVAGQVVALPDIRTPAAHAAAAAADGAAHVAAAFPQQQQASKDAWGPHSVTLQQQGSFTSVAGRALHGALPER